MILRTCFLSSLSSFLPIFVSPTLIQIFKYCLYPDDSEIYISRFFTPNSKISSWKDIVKSQDPNWISNFLSDLLQLSVFLLLVSSLSQSLAKKNWLFILSCFLNTPILDISRNLIHCSFKTCHKPPHNLSFFATT